MVQLTKEQRQANMAKARTARIIKDTAPKSMEPQAVPDVIKPLADKDKETVDLLNQVLDKLATTGNRQQVELVQNQVIGRLHDLPIAARIELVKHPLIQEALTAIESQKTEDTDLPPGTILPGGPGWEEGKDPAKYPWSSVPWTREKMIKAYEMVHYTPRQSRPVTVNDVRWDLIADEDNYVPSIIRDVDLQSYKQERDDARQFRIDAAAGKYGGFIGRLNPGAGWNPEAPDFERQG